MIKGFHSHSPRLSRRELHVLWELKLQATTPLYAIQNDMSFTNRPYHNDSVEARGEQLY